jgi:two-component system, OmpR family, response regulator
MPASRFDTPNAVVMPDRASTLAKDDACWGKVMRHRILVVAQDIALRSTLARWLMSVGHSVELAESDRRAREILAHSRIALTIRPGGHSGTPVGGLDANSAERILVTAPSQDTVLAPTARADGSLSVPLDERAVLTAVEVALQAQASLPDGHAGKAEMLFFDGLTVDLGGHSLWDCRGSEVPLTRSEFALLAAFVRNPGRVLSRNQLLDAVAGRGSGALRPQYRRDGRAIAQKDRT